MEGNPANNNMMKIIEDCKVELLQYKLVKEKNISYACATSFNIFREIFLIRKVPDDYITDNAIKEEEEEEEEQTGKQHNIFQSSPINDDSTSCTTAADSYVNFDHYHYKCNSCGSSDVLCKSDEYGPPAKKVDFNKINNIFSTTKPLVNKIGANAFPSSSSISGCIQNNNSDDLGPFSTFK